jgi:hypothetical protein
MNESFIDIDKENEHEQSFKMTCTLCDIQMDGNINDDLTIDYSELTKHLKTKMHLSLEKNSYESNSEEHESNTDTQKDSDDDFNEWLTYKSNLS